MGAVLAAEFLCGKTGYLYHEGFVGSQLIKRSKGVNAAMNRLKEIWANRWVRFGVVTFLYLLWFVVWTGNLWLLLGVVVIYDIYISKWMYRLFWKKTQGAQTFEQNLP